MIAQPLFCATEAPKWSQTPVSTKQCRAPDPCSVLSIVIGDNYQVPMQNHFQLPQYLLILFMLNYVTFSLDNRD